MDEFDDDYSEMADEIEQMSDEELDALESYANREYTLEDREQDEITVSKQEVDAAISKDKLEGYIDRKGQPSTPEGSALERYENVDISTRHAKNPTVEYTEETVRIDGRSVTGSFPEFESSKDVQLPDDLRFSRINQQEKYCNAELQKDVTENPDKYRDVFDEKQMEDIRSGKTPEGFTWHHHQEVGRMQLVDSKEHNANRHDGGFILWGGEKR